MLSKLRMLLKNFWVWLVTLVIVSIILNFLFSKWWAISILVLIGIVSRIWIDGDEK